MTNKYKLTVFNEFNCSELENAMADEEPDVPQTISLESMDFEELIELSGHKEEYIDDIFNIMITKFRVHEHIISIDNVENAPRISFDKEVDTICIDDFDLAIKFLRYFNELITKLELKLHELRPGIEALVRNYPNLGCFYSVHPDGYRFPLSEQIFNENPQIELLELRNYRPLEYFHTINQQLPNLHTFFFEVHEDLFDDSIPSIYFDSVVSLHVIIMVDVPRFILPYFPLVFNQIERLSIYDYWNNEYDWVETISRNKTLEDVRYFETPSDFYENLRNETK